MREILFKGESITYKEILQIDEITIYANKITCIVGESGGGKTTLLKLLNKLISPTSGKLYYKDQDLDLLPSIEHRKEVILLAQKPYIYPKTILDNFNIASKYHNLTLDEAKIHDLLKEVSLDKPLDFEVSNLSGGEAQRLALARVIALNSEVILLDEPSSALDDETEKLVIEQIVRYVKSHEKTLVMVTHSKQVANTYADHIYTIDKGQIKGRVNNGL
jgi:putative ABC transport system ATP-binding protein